MNELRPIPSMKDIANVDGPGGRDLEESKREKREEELTAGSRQADIIQMLVANPQKSRVALAKLLKEQGDMLLLEADATPYMRRHMA